MLLLQSACSYCRVHAAYAATAEQMLLMLLLLHAVHAAAAIKPYTVSAANSATSSQQEEEELQPPVDRLLQKPVKISLSEIATPLNQWLQVYPCHSPEFDGMNLG